MLGAAFQLDTNVTGVKSNYVRQYFCQEKENEVFSFLEFRLSLVSWEQNSYSFLSKS